MAFTNERLAHALRLLPERGTSKEWRHAVLEEAALRLEGKVTRKKVGRPAGKPKAKK